MAPDVGCAVPTCGALPRAPAVHAARTSDSRSPGRQLRRRPTWPDDDLVHKAARGNGSHGAVPFRLHDILVVGRGAGRAPRGRVLARATVARRAGRNNVYCLFRISRGRGVSCCVRRVCVFTLPCHRTVWSTSGALCHVWPPFCGRGVSLEVPGSPLAACQSISRSRSRFVDGGARTSCLDWVLCCVSFGFIDVCPKWGRAPATYMKPIVEFLPFVFVRRLGRRGCCLVRAGALRRPGA